MKVSFFAILIALCLIGQTAQSQIFKSKRPYKVWVSPMATNAVIKGYIIQTKDSSIVISQFPTTETTSAAFVEVDINTIKHLKFRKDGKVGRSIWQVALAELALSMALMQATGDPFVGAAGIMYMPAAAVIGGAIGVLKTKVPINGNQLQYQQSRDKLLKYTIKGAPVTQPLEASTSGL
ncbi:hypothetical protein ACXYMU_11570 [Pontibacter sp. CAU 1760]